MALSCKNCAHEIAIDSAGRIAPWCSHCGADVPRDPAERQAGTRTANVEASHRLTPPVDPSRETGLVDEKTHRAEPMRFQLAWYEPAAFRRALEPVRPVVRWIRNSLFALSVTTGLGLAAIYGFGELFLPPLPLIISKTLGTGLFCLIGIPLVIIVAARTLSCYVTIGPHGITRIRSIPMGHHVMVHRWGFPWKEIQEIVYIEDCPLGDRGWRVLVVRSVAGEEEILGIANDVTREQVAETIAAWGKQLETVSEPRHAGPADDLSSISGAAEPLRR